MESCLARVVGSAKWNAHQSRDAANLKYAPISRGNEHVYELLDHTDWTEHVYFKDSAVVIHIDIRYGKRIACQGVLQLDTSSIVSTGYTPRPLNRRTTRVTYTYRHRLYDARIIDQYIKLPTRDICNLFTNSPDGSTIRDIELERADPLLCKVVHDIRPSCGGNHNKACGWFAMSAPMRTTLRQTHPWHDIHERGRVLSHQAYSQ
jgi:hypothetical protein